VDQDAVRFLERCEATKSSSRIARVYPPEWITRERGKVAAPLLARTEHVIGPSCGIEIDCCVPRIAGNDGRKHHGGQRRNGPNTGMDTENGVVHHANFGCAATEHRRQDEEATLVLAAKGGMGRHLKFSSSVTSEGF